MTQPCFQAVCAAVAVTVAVKRPRAIFASGPFGWSGVVGRGGVEPPTFRFSGIATTLLTVLVPR
jgi:hypothetical protein